MFSNYEMINNLIANSTKALTCGPDCQKAEKTAQLKQAYLEARTNVETAPIKLQTALQNYITFTQGTSGYTSYTNQVVNEQADTITTQIQSNFYENIKKAIDLLSTLETSTKNFENTYELSNNYDTQINELKTNINEISSDAITNDRKSYYENQNNEASLKWYVVYRWIYFFLLIIYILGLILIKTEMSFKSKIGIFVLLLVYPFVINFIVLYLISVGRYISSLLPKNIYKSL
jgi:hypothetical protein